jgi:Tir chaperone protein (CesT) family
VALRDLMAVFAARIGLPEAELEADGGARITLGDALEIDIVADEDGPGFAMIATVGNLPRERRVEAFAEMLEANAAGLGSPGACLGLDPERDEIVLRRHFPETDIAIGLFDEELAAFGQELELWQRRSAAGALGTDAAAEAPEDAPGARRPIGIIV